MNQQKKRITLRNTEVSYTIRKSRRAKNVSVTVYPGARIVGTLPSVVPTRVLEKFMKAHASWILKKVEEFERAGTPMPSLGTATEYKKYKEEARIRIQQAIDDVNTVYNFSYGKVSIRNQKTRWGSCSSNKNLSFNYQIIFLPPALMNYIVAHEICHLTELNHSKRFWALVEKAVPDYKKIRKQLKSIYLG